MLLCCLAASTLVPIGRLSSDLGLPPARRHRRSLRYGSLVRFKETTPVTVKPRGFWLRRQDSNLRPLGYEPNKLPTAPLRDINPASVRRAQTIYHRSTCLSNRIRFSGCQIWMVSAKTTRMPSSPTTQTRSVGRHPLDEALPERMPARISRIAVPIHPEVLKFRSMPKNNARRR